MKITRLIFEEYTTSYPELKISKLPLYKKLKLFHEMEYKYRWVSLHLQEPNKSRAQRRIIASMSSIFSESSKIIIEAINNFAEAHGFNAIKLSKTSQGNIEKYFNNRFKELKEEMVDEDYPTIYQDAIDVLSGKKKIGSEEVTEITANALDMIINLTGDNFDRVIHRFLDPIQYKSNFSSDTLVRDNITSEPVFDEGFQTIYNNHPEADITETLTDMLEDRTEIDKLVKFIGVAVDKKELMKLIKARKFNWSILIFIPPKKFIEMLKSVIEPLKTTGKFGTGWLEVEKDAVEIINKLNDTSLDDVDKMASNLSQALNVVHHHGKILNDKNYVYKDYNAVTNEQLQELSNLDTRSWDKELEEEFST